MLTRSRGDRGGVAAHEPASWPLRLAGPFTAASAFATSYIAFLGDIWAVMAVTASALVAVALTSSAFVFLGLVTTQAIGIGLLYIVVWEGPSRGSSPA